LFRVNTTKTQIVVWIGKQAAKVKNNEQEHIYQLCDYSEQIKNTDFAILTYLLNYNVRVFLISQQDLTFQVACWTVHTFARNKMQWQTMWTKSVYFAMYWLSATAHASTKNYQHNCVLPVRQEPNRQETINTTVSYQSHRSHINKRQSTQLCPTGHTGAKSTRDNQHNCVFDGSMENSF